MTLDIIPLTSGIYVQSDLSAACLGQDLLFSSMFPMYSKA